MNRKSFIDTAGSLAITHPKCVFFTTDLEKYTFIHNQNFEVKGVGLGDPVRQGSSLEKCIQERKSDTYSVDRNVYGIRIKVWVWTLEDDEGQFIGACGVFLPKLHPVAQSFEYIAKPLANAFPEGAFLTITSLDRIVYRQSGDKFDIPALQEGTMLNDNGVAAESMRRQQALVKDIGPEVYGVACRGVSVPQYDPEDKDLVGTFTCRLNWRKHCRV